MSQTGKNFGYSKVTAVVLSSYFKGVFIVITDGFLTDSVLKFSAKIDTFIRTPKIEFLHFSIDSPVQCCPEKANFMQNFCS